MKHLLIFRIILLSVCCFVWTAFQAQSRANLLSYNDSINYTEGRIKIRDTLYIEVFHEKPAENYTCVYSLELAFINPRGIGKNKVLNLSKDTAAVKSRYFVFEPGVSSNLKPGSAQISGRVEIVEWAKRKATVKLDVSVDDTTRNERWNFVGRRSFRKRAD